LGSAPAEVLFDLDGNLIDSAPAIYASLSNVEREFGCVPHADLAQPEVICTDVGDLASAILRLHDAPSI
jgi:beta-phosphoglucomutase-like phosphatase (HAD superfamily)